MRLIVAIFILLLVVSCNKVTERMPRFDVHGIDVSHYQARVNWDTVAAQKIDFAFVKATEGMTHSDTLFRHNWNEIKRVGMRRGAYHFFRPRSSVLKQAQNFMKNVQLEEGDLPPVLDVEVADGTADEVVIKRIRTWVEIIEHHYKIRPIIYTNLKFFKRYIHRNFDDYPIWIARYNTKEPYLGNKRPWDFWQYGDKGQLKGINGFVDFNVFRGSLLELESLCLSNAPVYSLGN